MLLKIQTLSCPPPDTPESIQAQFGAAGGRIGRSPPCTLILPDPNRHISREHAEVRFRGDGFSLKVVSKVNSVVVNDAVVGPGEAVPLHDGDQILIGEYLLRAAILPSVAAPPPAPSFFAPPPPSSSAGSPFDMFEGLGSARPAAAAPEPAPDWFRAPPVAVPPPPPALAGDGMADFFNPTAEGRAFADLLKTTPPPSHPEVFEPPASVAPADTRLDEFLGLHDPTALASPGGLGAGSSDLYRVSPLDMPLQSAAVPVKPTTPAPLPTPSTHDDIFKALEQDFSALAPPAAPLPPSSVPLPIPAVSMPAVPIAPPMPPVPLAPPMPVTPSFQVEPAPPPFQHPGAALPVPQALAGDDIPTMRLTPAPVAPTPTVMPPMAAGPVAAGASMAPFPSLPEPGAETVPGQAEAAAEAARQRMLRVLIEAMGLNPPDVDTSDPEQTMRIVGELLRLSTDGLFRLLEMRSQLKSELHIEDRTMIASRENNPLKHADTARDAISYLVDRRQHGNKLFMPPAKAVEDTIWDICAHEMAVMAGTRAALLAALKMFSPEVIEGRIKKSGALENVLPALYKSRLWERFLGMYAELQTEAEDHFDRLLNQEFSKAYTEQSKKLKKKR